MTKRFLSNARIAAQTDGRTGGVVFTGSVTPTSPTDGDIWIDNSLSTDPGGNTYISGSLSVSNGMFTLPQATGVANNVPTTNSIALNNRSYIFDDGNLHINTNDATIWINSNNATPVQINTQGTASTGGLIVGGTITASNISDSGWIAPSSFSNSFASVTNSVGYRKINNVVYLRGSIQSGTAETTAFTLPTGYRPGQSGTYPTQHYGTSSVTYITVNSDGTVVPHTTATWLSGVAIPTG